MSDLLPPDIILQILHNLPIGTLVRCTCVCKQWHSLITTPDFITTHLSLTLSKPKTSHPLLLRRFTEPPKKEHFSLHVDHENLLNYQTIPTTFKAHDHLFFRIVGTIHGLICLVDDLFGYMYTLIIWNPLIKRYIKVPHPRVTYDLVGPYMYVLGFGFDSKSNDYKVVRIAYVQERRGLDKLPPLVEVFSVRERKWREVNGRSVDYWIVEYAWSQCFYNGLIHWIAFEKKGDRIFDLILMFDVEEERFKRMKLPESLVHTCPLLLYVKVVEGLLSVIEYHRTEDNRRYDIWVRKEYGVAKSWSKMYSVELGAGVETLPVPVPMLELRPNGEFLRVAMRGELVSHDPKSQETKDVGIEGFVDSFYACTYTESLVLLDKGSGALSYGGAKKMEKSSGAHVLEEEDESIMLNSEETAGNARSWSAEMAVNMSKNMHLAFQMMKFREQ